MASVKLVELFCTNFNLQHFVQFYFSVLTRLTFKVMELTVEFEGLLYNLSTFQCLNYILGISEVENFDDRTG